MGFVTEIKHLMVDREFISMEIKHDQNRVADRLTLYSRTENTIVVWLGRSPLCVNKFVPLDSTLSMLNKTFLPSQKKNLAHPLILF